MEKMPEKMEKKVKIPEILKEKVIKIPGKQEKQEKVLEKQVKITEISIKKPIETQNENKTSVLEDIKEELLYGTKST